MNKANLRKKLLTQRKKLTTDVIKSKSDLVVAGVVNSNLFKDSKNIAVYWPFNGEVDLRPLLKIKNKNFYLPSIEKKCMQFHLYKDQSHLKQKAYGITQPVFDKNLAKPSLDLCLMPLVAFDQRGNRLGMGGGFYDRYFEHNKQTILAGVAYAFQCVSDLPADDWDVKLQHTFTEQGLISI